MEARCATPEGQPYMFTKAIQAVKEAVPVIDVADLLCGPGSLRKQGMHWFGNCPLPDHEDKTPSFVVYPGTDSWWCFGCSRGSDVLDLYQLAHGFAEKWEALVALASERGVELPRRSERWHKRQDEKSKVRDVAAEARKAVRRERLFKLLVLSGPEFDIEDEGERREAVGHAWDIFNTGMKRIGQ